MATGECDDGPRILVIDDEVGPMNMYIEKLTTSGYVVERPGNISAALEAIASGRQYVAIVLDIMMPQGKYGSVATDSGLETGVRVYEDIRNMRPQVNVVVFTIRSDISVQTLGAQDQRLVVLQKLDYEPADLLSVINQLSGSRQSEECA